MFPAFQVNPYTWIISDTHFGHKNIVKYCNRPMSHNDLMYDAWTSRVRPDDTVLHLGDLAVWYGETSEYWHRVAELLPGQKYMLRGNHDLKKDQEYAKLGFTVIPEFVQKINGQRVLFSHYPQEESIQPYNSLGKWDINIHGHIHNNAESQARLASINRRYINVSIEVMDYKPVRLCDIIQV